MNALALLILIGAASYQDVDAEPIELKPGDPLAIISRILPSEVNAWTSEKAFHNWQSFVNRNSEVPDWDRSRKQYIIKERQAGHAVEVVAGTPAKLVRAFDAGGTLMIEEAEVEVTSGPLKGKKIIVGPMDIAEAGTKPLKKYEPAKNYKPKIGDRIVLYSASEEGEPFRTVTAQTSEKAYGDYWKYLKIKDYAGERELEQQGETLEIETRTKVLILDLHGYPDSDFRADSAEVRILEGR